MAPPRRTRNHRDWKDRDTVFPSLDHCGLSPNSDSPVMGIHSPVGDCVDFENETAKICLALPARDAVKSKCCDVGDQVAPSSAAPSASSAVLACPVMRSTILIFEGETFSIENRPIFVEPSCWIAAPGAETPNRFAASGHEDRWDEPAVPFLKDHGSSGIVDDGGELVLGTCQEQRFATGVQVLCPDIPRAPAMPLEKTSQCPLDEMLGLISTAAS